ncbi:endonuclease/exonuclease/phosphatase family protein [Flavicella sediminum]|uniref:endonuclease/exonuclease/phosphatase family protein n=1 Tax=Flavicella sediminum TaxID=2585141 RepID=UPI00111EC847|nr:endonuclease/exonuclease/phosphatase family protein [Flavicella sediminum]
MERKIHCLLAVLLVQFLSAQTRQYKIHTVAFYNLENLFDTIDHPDKMDEESPILKIKHGRTKIYRQKLNNMAKVLSEIGREKTNTSPSLIGVAEIENRMVLEELIATDYLKAKNYGIVHYESPDQRGIDVGLLYKKDVFIPISHKNHELKIWSDKGYRIFTRDQLVVSGYLENELIYVIVNHWPSRRGGEKRSKHLREKAAFLNKTICDSIFNSDKSAKIILMGDLNDDPTNSSLKTILLTKKHKKKVAPLEWYNPFELLFEHGYSTLGYRDNINLFDQIIVNGNLLSKNNNFDDLKFYQARIFNPNYLTVSKGRYKGYPYRSFTNNSFSNGYSDHYPVYLYLLKKRGE